MHSTPNWINTLNNYRYIPGSKSYLGFWILETEGSEKFGFNDNMYIRVTTNLYIINYYVLYQLIG